MQLFQNQLKRDKKLHAIVGFGITFLTTAIFLDLFIGLTLGIIAGLAKEWIDYKFKYGTTDLDDFVYTVAGSAMAFCCSFRWCIRDRCDQCFFAIQFAARKCQQAEVCVRGDPDSALVRLPVSFSLAAGNDARHSTARCQFHRNAILVCIMEKLGRASSLAA